MPTLDPQLEDLGMANEGTTVKLGGQLLDEDEAAVPLAGVASLKLWVTNESSGAVINGRAGTNILNANGGTLHPTSGAWTLKLASADSPIVVAGSPYERHRILVEWTYNAGVDKGTWEGVLTVRNLSQI